MAKVEIIYDFRFTIYDFISMDNRAKRANSPAEEQANSSKAGRRLLPPTHALRSLKALMALKMGGGKRLLAF
ncbi:MAG: hypothetical protein IKJ56_11530 [Bacteroidales bacterium]|nr:hypothetical protein [Bacteroidales bacterium]